ncbi:MAG TPA: hypothetical protein DDY38_00310 [Firmicutes bacterium]|nr:hypothetical protein [Bacillota bacterium]
MYNLRAEQYCFLDPAWNNEQLRDIIALLPRHCRLHFFGGAVPEDVLQPNLNLLRLFYKGWRDKNGEQDLLSLLPADLAEPLLLERVLGIFAEAGLAGKSGEGWTLAPVQGNVDLTLTKAWREYGAQLAAYRDWLKGFSSQSINQMLA